MRAPQQTKPKGLSDWRVRSPLRGSWRVPTIGVDGERLGNNQHWVIVRSFSGDALFNSSRRGMCSMKIAPETAPGEFREPTIGNVTK
jgi:hypothetical protein